MSFCIPSFAVNEFKQKIKSGELSPDKLIDMSSSERREAFKFLGEEQARKVNALFESKLLLKNQQVGIINWAKTVANMKPAVLRDTLAKVERLDKVMEPKELDSFLEDLVAQRLGIDVSMKEAADISTLAKEVASKRDPLNTKYELEREKIRMDLPAELRGDDGVVQAELNKRAMDTKSELFKDRMEYGRSLVKFNDYIKELKLDAERPTLQDFKERPISTSLEQTGKLAGLSKSIVASLDNSILLNQGLKVLFNNPKIWAKNAKQTFVDMYHTFGGKDVMAEVKAEILSRPNAMSGLYKKEGLAVGVAEEAFPVSLQNKVPVIGRAFEASENAFTGFQYRTRADLFDKYYEIANQLGVDYTGIGRVANTLTGRGDLGRLEGSKGVEIANNLFFSPRYIMANLDTLTLSLRHHKVSSPFARKQAAMNSLRTIAAIGTILTIANAINDDSVEEDARSSDFGKIRVGNTRVDVTGGLAGYATLGMRLATMSTKSPSSGKVSELNTGKFGARTGWDVTMDFTANKFSPPLGAVRDVLRGRDFDGNKPTVGSVAKNLIEPLPIKTYAQLKDDPDGANVIAGMILNGLGLNTSTFK
jgi:hypothetical protein